MTCPASPVLVFDLGGVIVDHDNAVMHRRLASGCRPDMSVEHIAALTGDERWGTGRPVIELFDQLREQAGYTGDRAGFVADWCCHLVLNPSMLAFVEGLAARHRVIIFSNTNHEHWNYVVAASGGRLGAFERVLSHEIGHAKPSAMAFEILSNTAGVRPEGLLFFDDVATNVEGARRAGLRAELFENEAVLRAFLTARGLYAA